MSTTTVELHHGHHDPTLAHHFATKDQQFDSAKLGMWLFLATEIMLFGVLFVGFGLSQTKWPEEFKEAHHHLQRPLGAMNTIVLLISSWTMVMGVLSAKRGKKQALSIYLFLTISLRLHLSSASNISSTATNMRKASCPASGTVITKLCRNMSKARRSSSASTS